MSSWYKLRAYVTSSMHAYNLSAQYSRLKQGYIEFKDSLGYIMIYNLYKQYTKEIRHDTRSFWFVFPEWQRGLLFWEIHCLLSLSLKAFSLAEMGTTSKNFFLVFFLCFFLYKVYITKLICWKSYYIVYPKSILLLCKDA